MSDTPPTPPKRLTLAWDVFHGWREGPEGEAYSLTSSIKSNLRRSLEDSRASAVSLRAACEEAKAEVAMLRAALAPFAKYAESFPPIVFGFHRATDDGIAMAASKGGKDYTVTFTDFRAAAAALTVATGLYPYRQPIGPMASPFWELMRETGRAIREAEDDEPTRGDTYEPKL